MVIDMQYSSAHPEHGIGARAKAGGFAAEFEYFFERIESQTIPNIRRLLAACREAGIPVVFVRMMNLAGDCSDTSWRYKEKRNLLPPGSKGSEILQELAPEPGEVVINKTTASVFISSHADFVLRNMGVDTIVMTGAATNVCVESCARDAGDLGYRVLLAEDACATASQDLHDHALRELHGQFALVKSTDVVLDEIREAVVARAAVPA
jgi:ureidoacrylate peracid hydrolase